jgi:hypothetical protein
MKTLLTFLLLAIPYFTHYQNIESLYKKGYLLLTQEKAYDQSIAIFN